MITRRALGLGTGAMASGLMGRAEAAIPTADVPTPDLPIEQGASLRVLRPTKFVATDETVFNENTARFTAATGVKVRVDYAGWEDLRPQTAVTASTGAGPDVVLGWTDDPHLYADQVLDLTEQATYLGQKYGGWYPLAEQYGRRTGTDRWIALPMGGSGSPAVYRESWVKEAGFDAFPKDLDGLLRLCRTLKANGHPAGFACGHAVGDANAYCHWLVWAFGGAMVDEQNKVIINSRETIEALKFAREIHATFIPGTNDWNDASNNNALIAGQIGATQNGVSLYFSIKNSADPRISALTADLNHARMPVGPVGHSTEVALAINAMVFTHTKAPNAAKAYLTFMLEAPQYDHWLTDTLGYWTQPLKAYAASEVWQKDPRIRAYQDTMQDSLWLGYKGAISEASGAVLADYVMVDMVAAASTGAATPQDAAKEAERRAKRYYK